MGMFFHREPLSDQLRFNGRKFGRRNHDVSIHREHRLNIAVDSEPAHETPAAIPVQNLNQQSEIAASTISHRFENFGRSHVLMWSAATRRRFDSVNAKSKAVTSHRTPKVNSNSFKYSRGTHAAADAHRHHAVTAVASLKLAQDRGR